MKKGVIIVNLGTPKKATKKEIAKFLTNFLKDRRVVDLSPFVWYPLLYAIVLPLRLRRIQHSYQKIWLKEGAPLQYHMQQIVKKLQYQHSDMHIELAMTYGEPSIVEAMQRLQQAKVTHWMVLPLYPQYSTTTTAPVEDQVRKYLDRMGEGIISAPTILQDYATHPLYIKALKETLLQAMQQHGSPDLILLSYHGIPLRYAKRGDCYPERCQSTTESLKQQLPEWRQKIIMAYQSRFGREPWLPPYTDHLLKELPLQGVKKILVLCPGFSVDCLETLEEMAQQDRRLFLEAGGESYHYVAALNSSEAQLQLCSKLIEEVFHKEV